MKWEGELTVVSRDYADLELLASIIERAKEHKPEQQAFDFDAATTVLAEHGIRRGLKPKELARAVERRALIELAEVCQKNKKAMARAMNIHRNTLQRTLREFQLEVSRRKKVGNVAAQDEGKKQA